MTMEIMQTVATIFLALAVLGLTAAMLQLRWWMKHREEWVERHKGDSQ